jgi:hypothetical protein
MLGGYLPPKHDVQITIVQVKTKKTPSNGMKPVKVEPVDRITRAPYVTGNPSVPDAALQSPSDGCMPYY